MFTPLSSQAQSSKTYYKGIIQSLDDLTVILDTKIRKETKALNNSKELLQKNRPQKILLDEPFITALLYFSDRNYVSLFRSNKCSFYAALESDLFKTKNAHSPFNIHMAFEDEGILRKAAIDKKTFFINYYKNQCFNNFEISQLFQESNLKETINSLSFPVPKDDKQCLAIHDNWLNNPNTPYLCGIIQKTNLVKTLKKQRKKSSGLNLSQTRYFSEKIKEYQSLKKYFSKFQYKYLSSLCPNLNNPNLFCDGYLDESLWSRIINNEKPSFLLSYKCQNFLNKKKIGPSDLKKCKQSFTKNSLECSIPSITQKKSLFPRPDCAEIEKALTKSHLITNYHDCPGNIRHQGVLNFYRIMNHFEPQKEVFDTTLCSSDPVKVFQEATDKEGNENAWNVQVCYEDKIKNKKTCKKTLFTNHPRSELSHEKVIASILPRFSSSISDKLSCRYIDAKIYNPQLLEFQEGCAIVYDPNFCNSLFCPQEIYFNKKKITDIDFFAGSTIPYLPSSYSKAQYSLTTLFEKKFIKSQAINNTTELKAFLRQDQNNIIHGVGCGEDLLPQNFTNNNLNKCTPIYFLIDGFFEKDLKTYTIVRTAIDDIHSPRIIKWNYIFSAISSYKNIHPINTWPLYGIKK